MACSELQFGRLIPAMVTPFTEDLELDLPRVRELANRLIEGGADSILVNATTGEAPTIFYPSKIELFKAVIDEVAGRVPVIAYSGDNCTADSVDFSKQVEELGVDGLLLVVPYYNKPPQEGMYQHFKAIAEAVDLPCLLYNIPGRCGVNMTAETTLRLAHDVPNIVGIKEASGDLDQVKAIIDGAPEGFVVYSGDDSSTLDIMKLGGVGVVSTIGNVCPERMKEIIDLFVAGKIEEAEAKNEALLPLMNGLFATTNPILPKEALKLLGFPVGGVRLPLVDATPEQSAQLEKVMREVGVL